MANGTTRSKNRGQGQGKGNCGNRATISSTSKSPAGSETTNTKATSANNSDPRRSDNKRYMGNTSRGGKYRGDSDSLESSIDNDNNVNEKKRSNYQIEQEREDYKEFQKWKKQHHGVEHPIKQISKKSRQDVSEISEPPGDSKLAFKKIRAVVSANIKNYIKVECYSHMKFCSNDKLARRLCEESINTGYVVIPSRYTKYEFTHYFGGSVLSGFASLRHNSATLSRRNYNSKMNITEDDLLYWLLTSTNSVSNIIY